MSLAQVWGEIQEHNRRIVLHETFGHLDPQPGCIYEGWVVFAQCCTSGDGAVVIQWELKEVGGQELMGGPEFYLDIHSFIMDEIDKQKTDLGYGVWHWEGRFKVFKNGKSRWSGKTRPCRISHRFGDRRSVL